MAQVIQGHNLRSNQYLVAKVYDADSLNTTKEDRDASENEPYFVNGQVLIIKGTEISFYIPPTGIEVKAINNDPSKGYVRDAVTLERLEYCILKDEDGNKRYVHGPTVVFPEPTESFIKDGNGHIKRNAIELSDISGVYVKVVADYKDDNGKEHKAGEELFITGKDQMIYYPRPEHTFITYNGKVMHHAVAIPKGEGRYIMNRMTGEIKTVRGPAMLEAETRATEFELTVAAQRDKDEEDKRKYEIEKEIQSLKDAIFEAEQLRLQKEREAELEHRRKMFEIESAREAAAADSMKTILEALGPDLAAALTTRSNQAVVEKIAESIAPYAVAGGQPVSRAVSELLRGTTLESVIDTLKKE